MLAADTLDRLTTLANDRFRTDEIEIDSLQSEKDLSVAPEGVWVRAWVFLSNDDIEGAGHIAEPT